MDRIGGKGEENQIPTISKKGENINGLKSKSPKKKRERERKRQKQRKKSQLINNRDQHEDKKKWIEKKKVTKNKGRNKAFGSKALKKEKERGRTVEREKA